MNLGTQHTFGANGDRNQANSATNSHNQNQFGFSDTGSQTLSETFNENGVSGSKSSSSSHSSQVNHDGNSAPISKRSVQLHELEINHSLKRNKRQVGWPGAQQYGFQNGLGGNQQQMFNPYQNFGASQQNANGNSLAQNQNPFFNQNAGANTHSSNLQNPFGSFQNNGGSSISANLANDGSAGQLSSANTDQQNYLNAFGFGNKNNAQSQSANFDPFGNLQTSSTNTGTQHTVGPDGERNQATGASNSHNQNQFGNSDSGSQTLSETFDHDGVSGSKSSSASHSSQVNNGGAFPGTNTIAGAGNGFGFGSGTANGNNFYGGYPQQGFNRFGRFKRDTKDALIFPNEEKPKQVGTEKVPEKMVSKTEGDKAQGVKPTNGTGENQPEELESRFGLPGHPIRTAIREALGGLFGGEDRGYGSYSNGPQYGNRPRPPAPPYYQPAPNSYHHNGRPEYGRPEYGRPEYGRPEYGRPEYERPQYYPGGGQQPYYPPQV